MIDEARPMPAQAYAKAATVGAEAVRPAKEIAKRAQKGADKQAYFKAVAQVRYIMRKVFRIVDDHAKRLGLDPLSHQALLQVYGSSNQALRMSALAERLDIDPPFASSLVKSLVKARLLRRSRLASDMRVAIIEITDAGRNLCHQIDSSAKSRVDALIARADANERAIARSSLMFYIGRRSSA
jgi:DNA-binding MarR family transcriptional regulator